jgi:hypothetical protein
MARAKRRVAIKKPPILFARSQRILERLEAALGVPVLTYWTSPAGSVCDSDVVALYEHVRALQAERIALFIKSDGGSGQASLRIVNLLRQHTKSLDALVPLECASAATMIALGADTIRMGPLAFLTAIDTSLRHELSPVNIDNELVSVSQDELGRVVRLWHEAAERSLASGAAVARAQSNDGPRQDATSEAIPYQALFQHVHPLVVGAVDRVSSLSIRLCREILSYHLTDAAEAERISQHLNSDYPSHNYPITLREARRIGLHVQPLEGDVNDLLLELNAVYSEMGQKAVTDRDEHNYHNNEIANIVESRGKLVYFQIDKDWHYRKEERRWDPMNDKSSWRKVERAGRTQKETVLHIR